MSRKTWDLNEYTKKSYERREENIKRWERDGKEEIKDDAEEIKYRSKRVDLYEGLNNVVLAQGTPGYQGKRGKSAGFYCQVCDLTYKDSIQYVDHLNSKQHLYASGYKDVVKRATIEDVRKRLNYLKQKVKSKPQTNTEFDIKERIAQLKDTGRSAREKRKAKKLKFKQRKQAT